MLRLRELKKIKSLQVVSPCVRAAASARFRLALCAMKGGIVEAECSGTGEQCCYTCS